MQLTGKLECANTHTQIHCVFVNSAGGPGHRLRHRTVRRILSALHLRPLVLPGVIDDGREAEGELALGVVAAVQLALEQDVDGLVLGALDAWDVDLQGAAGHPPHHAIEDVALVRDNDRVQDAARLDRPAQGAGLVAVRRPAPDQVPHLGVRLEVRCGVEGDAVVIHGVDSLAGAETAGSVSGMQNIVAELIARWGTRTLAQIKADSQLQPDGGVFDSIRVPGGQRLLIIACVTQPDQITRCEQTLALAGDGPAVDWSKATLLDIVMQAGGTGPRFVSERSADGKRSALILVAQDPLSITRLEALLNLDNQSVTRATRSPTVD